jgi:hypothetical protein
MPLLRKTPPPAEPLPGDLPSTRRDDHADYTDARENWQRVKAELARLEREYAGKAPTAGKSRGDRRQEAENRVAEAFLKGDFNAALAKEPDYDSEVSELARLITVAHRAERVAFQRFQSAGEEVSAKVSRAHRPEYARRLQGVADKIAELMAAVAEADAVGNALKRGGTHTPRHLPLPNLGFFRQTRPDPVSGARFPSAAEIALKEIRKSYGIEPKGGAR